MVLRGTFTVTVARPERQLRTFGSVRSAPADEKRQRSPGRTRARSRTVPPAAGNVEGVAIRRSAFARRAVRRRAIVGTGGGPAERSRTVAPPANLAGGWLEPAAPAAEHTSTLAPASTHSESWTSLRRAGVRRTRPSPTSVGPVQLESVLVCTLLHRFHRCRSQERTDV